LVDNAPLVSPTRWITLPSEYEVTVGGRPSRAEDAGRALRSATRVNATAIACE
jgi:hypothetical protein